MARMARDDAPQPAHVDPAHVDEGILYALVEGSLDEPEAQRWQAHIESCDRCRELAGSVRPVASALHDLSRAAESALDGSVVEEVLGGVREQLAAEVVEAGESAEAGELAEAGEERHVGDAAAAGRKRKHRSARSTPPRGRRARRPRARARAFRERPGAFRLALVPLGAAAAVALVFLLQGRSEVRTRRPADDAAGTPSSEAAPACARVLEGQIEYARADAGWRSAAEGTVLREGDRVRTGKSRAVIRFETGTLLYANASTVLVLGGERAARRVELPAPGEIYLETAPADRGLSVATPHGRAVDAGTDFGVVVESAGTTVLVAKGAVIASTAAGEVAVGERQEVRLVGRDAPVGPVREARDVATRLAWTGRFEEVAAAEPPGGDVRLWLRFEGDARDSSAHGNHGALRGPSFVEGRFGKACSFDGVDDHVLVRHSPSLSLRDGSVEFWVRPRCNAHTTLLFAKDVDMLGNGGHIRLLSYGGEIEARIQSSTDMYHARSSQRLSAGKWHHVVTTFGERGFKLYADGALRAAHPYTGGIENNTENVRLGKWYNDPDYFHGLIDEFVVYARQLSAEEVRGHCRRGPPMLRGVKR